MWREPSMGHRPWLVDFSSSWGEKTPPIRKGRWGAMVKTLAWEPRVVKWGVRMVGFVDMSMWRCGDMSMCRHGTFFRPGLRYGVKACSLFISARDVELPGGTKPCAIVIILKMKLKNSRSRLSKRPIGPTSGVVFGFSRWILSGNCGRRFTTRRLSCRRCGTTWQTPRRLSISIEICM